MKNVIKKGSIIGVILGGMLIALMLIHSPIKIDLDISDIICGVVCGVLVCLTNCIITLSISKISPNYLYKKNNGQHGLLLNKTLICMLLVENVFAEELVFRSYLLSFINENWGNISAISITSILFIFYHSKPRIIELGVMGITGAPDKPCGVVCADVNPKTVAKRYMIVQKVVSLHYESEWQ